MRHCERERETERMLLTTHRPESTAPLCRTAVSAGDSSAGGGGWRQTWDPRNPRGGGRIVSDSPWLPRLLTHHSFCWYKPLPGKVSSWSAEREEIGARRREGELRGGYDRGGEGRGRERTREEGRSEEIRGEEEKGERESEWGGGGPARHHSARKTDLKDPAAIGRSCQGNMSADHQRPFSRFQGSRA
jgi:hypothetical protein